MCISGCGASGLTTGFLGPSLEKLPSSTPRPAVAQQARGRLPGERSVRGAVSRHSRQWFSASPIQERTGRDVEYF
jgi:hypothetical protein